MNPPPAVHSLALAWTLLWGAGLPCAAQDLPGVQAPAPVELTDEQLRKAWSYLLPDEQLDAAAYLRDALKHSASFQQTLIDFALTLEPRDHGQIPEAPPTPFYAPDIHAPRQPIDRKRLAPEDPRAQKQKKTMLAALPKTGMDSAWRYDWATREVQRTGLLLDPTRDFFNAFAGFAPDLDLGQALIERALDNGAEQAALTAFGHAYTDRAGLVYPGLTLYDAWCSATEMEMPDVDVLGVIHDLAKDWKTWIAPVPDTQHDELYGKVFGYFQGAKRQRGLRTALAQTFFSGSIELRDGYLGHRDRLHSWWDECSSTPADLAAQLPKSAEWAEFLEQWSARIDSDVALTMRGQVRRATLDADAAGVRSTAIAILKEFGALDRKSRPPLPPQAPVPDQKKREQ